MPDLSIVVVISVVFAFVSVLAYRLLNRNDNVRETRWGFFVQRDLHEGEVWTVDPLPPPTPPPPLPPRPDDETQTWPKREED